MLECGVPKAVKRVQWGPALWFEGLLNQQWCQEVGAKSFADRCVREEKVTTPLRSLSTITAPSTTLPEAIFRLGLRWYDLITSSNICVITCVINCDVLYVLLLGKLVEIATSWLGFPDKICCRAASRQQPKRWIKRLAGLWHSGALWGTLGRRKPAPPKMMAEAGKPLHTVFYIISHFYLSHFVVSSLTWKLRIQKLLCKIMSG